MIRISPTLISVLLIMLLALACRPDSGPDDYQSQELIADAAIPLTLPLAEGEERFGLGLFYEGETSEEVIIDDLMSHFYIYEETFSMIGFEGDRIEGVQSDRITHRGGGWWGGGVHWDEPRDLSAWDELHLSLKTSEMSFSVLELAMNNSDTEQTKISLNDYGFVTDGEWHDLNIPLSALSDRGLDLSQVSAPLVLIGGRGEIGDTLYIDAVFLSRIR